MFIKMICIAIACHQVSSFWDVGTTTIRMPRTDTTPRQSFFRWQWTSFPRWWFWYYDWNEIDRRRRLNVVAGISIDFYCLTTAIILNRRILISAYNPYDRYMHRQKSLRIWALGRAGQHITPYRYRVWRVTRLFPISGNPEHCHGPRCTQQPRHDVCIIVSLDQMYIFSYPPTRHHYAYRAFITPKYHKLYGEIWFAGSGYEYMQHVIENYKIFYGQLWRWQIVDCSVHLPKYWGKFICMKNTQNFAGVQNGGGLFDDTYLVGLGCFEIRINNDRVFAFTDLRYYHQFIYHYAHIWPGQYYEYAYPQWSVRLGWVWDSWKVARYNPNWQIQHDLYPLGRK